MDAIKDGGPAFPVECDWVDGKPQGRQTDNHAGWHEGMTLRDYFAAKAMQARMTAFCGLETHHGWTDDEIAADAYGVADAMLRAREVQS